MKRSIVVLGFIGFLANAITAFIRFSDGKTTDGLAWLLVGCFVLFTAITAARDW